MWELPDVKIIQFELTKLGLIEMIVLLIVQICLG